VAPFVVGNSTKVQSLNADQLDGLDSSAFTSGGGQFFSAHVERVQHGAQGTLLAVPGALTLQYECLSTPKFAVLPSNLDVAYDWEGHAGFFPRRSQAMHFAETDSPLFVHILASRPMSKSGDLPILVDLEIAAGWDAATSTCTFEAVGERFDA